MTTRTPEKMAEMPDLPREFGDDGGHFYRYYDELAEEYDENLVKNLKAQLDGILIFAGLFAGVNSTFLVFTLPQLSANPADDTNALLLQIALGSNSSITSTADLPSASFLPSPRIYLVNVLFSASLMLALFSSLLAVLGQQWIVYYRKQGGGGPDDRRWEQLRRYLGAKRWRLELVLDDLVPSLLQLGLVLFCIAFALHLGTLSQSLNRIIVSLLSVTAATMFAMATCAAFDPWCPFKQPSSRIAQSVASAVLAFAISFAIYSIGVFAIMASNIINAIWPNVIYLYGSWQGGVLEYAKSFIPEVTTCYRLLMSPRFQSAKDPDDLKIEALRRVICTSEDRNALIYAAMNLQVLRHKHTLSSLAKDHVIGLRLSALQEAAMEETRHGRSSNRYSLIQSKIFSTSYFHFMISTSSDPFIWRSGGILGIQFTAPVWTDFEEMSHLLEGSLLAINTSYDQCSHYETLLFSIRVAYMILESAKNHSLPDLQTTFKTVPGKSAGNYDLRLGFMVASAMLFLRQSTEEEWAVQNYQPQDKFLTALFAAYREPSERVMFDTISRALATVNGQWRGKPDHEIYVWLFELCQSPGRKDISEFDQHTVLEHVDDNLLSLENRVREEGASEIDRQHGRDCQNRYVQAVAGFCADQNYSSQRTWSLISAPVERYLKSVKELMENHSGHPENSKTLDLLLRMESVFAEPQPVGVSASDSNPAQSILSSNFRQLLDQIGLSVPEKALVSTERNGLQLATAHDDGKRVGLPTITPGFLRSPAQLSHEEGAEELSLTLLLPSKIMDINVDDKGEGAQLATDSEIVDTIGEQLCKDPAVKSIMAYFDANPDHAPAQLRKEMSDRILNKGLLRFRNRIYVPNNEDIKRAILQLYHDSIIAGHGGQASITGHP
ncbi:hypothetical protein FRC00_013115 [Tulasnella sp. 408]|nr:hypothetical protein FRC00_013115 [Tulasnella sp. 408]